MNHQPRQLVYPDMTALDIAAEHQHRHPEASTEECLKVGKRLKALDARLQKHFNGGTGR